MKYVFTLVMFFVFTISVKASEVQLIVQKVSNNGVVSGNTYRVYAQMPDAQHSLHIVFGDAQNPLSIESTAPLYQHEFGGNTAVNISEAATLVSPALAFDSYVTIGYTNGTDNSTWDIGVDFSNFTNGLSTTNGGWFLLPTDSKCLPDNSNLVLIGQFTTTGVVTGTMNLQGWTNPQEVWQAIGLTFSTNNAHIFGCTDVTATNYNASATFNDGTCQYIGNNNSPQAALTASENQKIIGNSWEIFPNPLRDDLIHFQFKNAIDFKSIITVVDIIDMHGKLVYSHIVNADSVVNGNRYTIHQNLAAGTYNVVITQGGKKETQTLLVEK